MSSAVALDDHPVSFEVAMATAEALADAFPPIDLTALAEDPALAELERTVGADVRIAILRARAGDWEVRPFDPDKPYRFGDDLVGHGTDATSAIADLVALLLD